jgi:hypothetical protein
MILSSEERGKRLDEFHKSYDENIVDEESRESTNTVIHKRTS